MKPNKVDMKSVIEKIKIIPQLLIQLVKGIYIRFKSLSVERQRGIIKGSILFIMGMLVGTLITLFITSTDNNSNNDVTTSEDAASTVAVEDATDWHDLVVNMCKPNSVLNLLAMKIDFPFVDCMRDNGQIDGACVKKDSARFKPTLPQPYQHNLGDLTVKISNTDDGSPIVHYVIPLKGAAFEQLPLTALAINITTKANSNKPIGWQTPHLVIQGDYSSIKSVLNDTAPAMQIVYYANIPATSDVLPGPFETYEEAKIVTRKAGGKVNLISKQAIGLEADFQEGLNEVALNCVARQNKRK